MSDATFENRSRLHGAHALVLGGNGHIGKVAIATLLELGASITSVDLHAPVGAEAASAAKLRFVRSDLGTPEGCDEAVIAAASDADFFGSAFKVIVHCAALVGTSDLKGWAVPFADQSIEAWQKALQVNVGSAFRVAQKAAPVLAENSSIVFVSSIYGFRAPDPSLYRGTAMVNPVAYGVSKAGLLQLVRYLAVELAPRTRVNAISPGGIERSQPSLFVDRYEEQTPLRRLGREDDLIGAFGYLASDLSSYVTGSNLVVDGGWSL